MDGKIVDFNNTMWVRSALLAYLTGEQTLKWVVDVIDDGNNRAAAQHFLNNLPDFGHPERREVLWGRLQSRAA